MLARVAEEGGKMQVCEGLPAARCQRVIEVNVFKIQTTNTKPVEATSVEAVFWMTRSTRSRNQVLMDLNT
jgi:hypothetical protein